MVKLYRGQKTNSVPFFIRQVIQEFLFCKKFKVLPTAPTMYEEKAKTVLCFQIIEDAIAKEEQRQLKKQQKSQKKGVK